jgi:hypothetical protein
LKTPTKILSPVVTISGSNKNYFREAHNQFRGNHNPDHVDESGTRPRD